MNKWLEKSKHPALQEKNKVWVYNTILHCHADCSKCLNIFDDDCGQNFTVKNATDEISFNVFV